MCGTVVAKDLRSVNEGLVAWCWGLREVFGEGEREVRVG